MAAHFALSLREFSIRWADRTSGGRYPDFPALREAVGRGLTGLVTRHSRDWFGGMCGRCGNSCRRPGVLVREQELLNISLALGICEAELRRDYLEPAATWNPGDAQLRLQEGACVFLEPGREAGTASCRIYANRPEACRAFAPSASICQKAPGLLIEQLLRVELNAESTWVVLRSGAVHQEPTDPDWYAELLSLGQGWTRPAQTGLESTAASVLALLEEMLAEFTPARVDDVYRQALGKVRHLVRSVADLAYLGPAVSHSAERMWGLLQLLEERVEQGEVESTPAPVSVASTGPELTRVWLNESGLRVEQAQGSQDLPLDEPLQGLVRPLVAAVLQRPEESLQVALQEEDPQCYLCGECCRFYQVEITPSDILRLAGHLGLTSAQFCSEYAEPPRLTWNPGACVLKKVERPRASRVLKELPVNGQTTVPECVFLERRSDGFFYCSVHSHKPDVCRGYAPIHPFCRNTNQIANWGRQSMSLLALEIGPQRYRIYTRRQARAGEPPLEFDRAGWPEVERYTRALEAYLSERLKLEQGAYQAGVDTP